MLRVSEYLGLYWSNQYPMLIYDSKAFLNLNQHRPTTILRDFPVFQVFLHKRVLQEEYISADVEAVKALNKKVHADPRVNVTMLSMADGVTLAFKK